MSTESVSRRHPTARAARASVYAELVVGIGVGALVASSSASLEALFYPIVAVGVFGPATLLSSIGWPALGRREVLEATAISAGVTAGGGLAYGLAFSAAGAIPTTAIAAIAAPCAVTYIGGCVWTERDPDQVKHRWPRACGAAIAAAWIVTLAALIVAAL